MVPAGHSDVMAVQAARPAAVLDQGEALEDKVEAVKGCSKDFETPSNEEGLQ